MNTCDFVSPLMQSDFMDPAIRDPFHRNLLFGFLHPSILWNIGIFLLVALIFYWLLKSSKKRETALDLLKKRYVTGEIDKDAFLQMKKDITD